MVVGRAAHDAHAAAKQDTMSPPTVQISSTNLSAMFDKLVDKDPNCRRIALEAIKELIHREVLTIDTILSIVTKKSKQYNLLSSSSDKASYSLLAVSSALLLAEFANSATQKQVKLSLPHITSTIKAMISWFPLDMGGSPSQSSLHQACAKLVCSLAENAATISIYDNSINYSPGSSSALNSDTEINDATSSTSCNSEEDDPFHEQVQQCALVMETLCTPLISAFCSKVEPVSRGATICLEALVSLESWRFAPPTLVEELSFRAFGAMQVRTASSASVAQMSLLCSLAKKNHESLSSFRAGLLKKVVEVLLNSGAWQQRVGAARLIECLLSMGGQYATGSKQDKQAIEALDKCKLDKVAMVRSAVGEALRIAKQYQELDRGSIASTPTAASMVSSRSSMTAPKPDYRKRRRKKPFGPYEKQLDTLSSLIIRTDPFSVNYDRWSSSAPSSVNWSSSESVNSSIDLKCPRKKVLRTGRWSNQINHTYKKNGCVTDSHGATSSSPALSSLAPTPSPGPSVTSSSPKSINKNSPSISSKEEETHKSALPLPHNLMTSLMVMEPTVSKAASSMPEDQSNSCSSGVKDTCLAACDDTTDDDADGADGKGNMSSATSANIHDNPIAQLAESLRGVESQACKPGLNDPVHGVLSATPMSLLQPKLEHMQYSDVGKGTREREQLSNLAWNVWNNPIATDDSELDSPRQPLFDSYSIVYCDDGDDDNDSAIIHGWQPVVSDDCPVHLTQHPDGADSDYPPVHVTQHPDGADSDYPVHVTQHVDGAGFEENCRELPLKNEDESGFVDRVSREYSHQGSDKVIDSEASVHHAVDDDYYVDSAPRALTLPQVECVKCMSGIASSTVALSEANSATHSKSEDAEASSREHDTKVLAVKEPLMQCGESQEDVDVELNLSPCESVPTPYCDACCDGLLQESFDYDKSSLHDDVRGARIGLTTNIDHCQAAIDNNCQVANQEDQMSSEKKQCNEDVPPPCAAAAGEHKDEDVSKNLGLESSSGTNLAHPDRDSFTDACLLQEHELKDSKGLAEATHVSESATYIAAFQSCPLPNKGLSCGDDYGRGEPAEESGNSILGWLRQWYVVKKCRVLLSVWPPSPFGALVLALTIPIAIVSIVNIFDTKEGGSDFLVPT